MIKVNCKHCGRYLGEVEVLVGELLCGNSKCAGGSQFKIISNDTEAIMRVKFTEPERKPKSAVAPPPSEPV